MAPDLIQGEQMFFAGDYQGAFDVFQRIAHDVSRSVADRSVAFSSMSSLVVAMPFLHPDDQTGLCFLQRAIELDSENDYAWWCVVESFGEHYPAHQDTHLLRRAISFLDRRSLTADERVRLRDQRARVERHLS